jgi:hypothetical protein
MIVWVRFVEKDILTETKTAMPADYQLCCFYSLYTNEKVRNLFRLSLFYAAQILTSHIIDKTLGSAQHCLAIII